MKAISIKLGVKRPINVTLLNALALVSGSLMPIVFYYLSTVVGRLKFDLVYDDVVYAVDVASRLASAAQGGPLAWATSFIADPPHSPLTTIFGTLGCLVFGVTENGFYAGNVVLSWGISLLLYFSFRQGDLKNYIYLAPTAVILASCSTLGYYLVGESRPDISSGILVALACLSIVQAVISPTQTSRIFTASLISMGLISKLTFIPHTVFVYLLVSVFVVVLTGKMGPKSTKEAVGIISRVAVTGVLISLPVMLIEFKTISDYVFQTLFTEDKQVWSFGANYSFLDLVREFLKPGWQRLGGLQTPAFYVFGIGVSLLLTKRSRLAPLTLVLAASGFASFFFMVLLRHVNEYFLSFFHSMSLIVAALTVGIIMAERSNWIDHFIFLFLLVGVVVISIVSLPLYAAAPAYPETVRSPKSDVQELADSLEKAEIKRIFLTFTGPLNQHNLQWKFISENQNIETKDGALVSLRDDLVREASEYEWVIVPNVLTSNYNSQMPSGKIQEAVILALLNAGYGADEAVNSGNTRYYVLRKNYQDFRPVLISAKGVAGKILRTNPDGSFTELLPLGLENEVCFFSSTAQSYKLHFEFLNSSVPQSVKLNGSEVEFTQQTRPTNVALGISSNLHKGSNCFNFVSKTEMILLAGADNYGIH